MKKVRIAAPAMRFVRHEKAYLKRVSRHAAVQFAQQLKQMTRTLSEFPGAGARMVREFAEYRPWKSWAQFDKEIGKYVGADGAAKLAQYCFIPVNLNTATDEDILSIPGAGTRMVREFKEYRPWKSWAQFDKEIGKYVGQKETDRLKRYVVIE